MSDSEMHAVLLEHFGLTKWKSEFPFSRVRFMSPLHLITERRAKEHELGLKRKEAVSDTVGYRIAADDFPG